MAAVDADDRHFPHRPPRLSRSTVPAVGAVHQRQHQRRQLVQDAQGHDPHADDRQDRYDAVGVSEPLHFLEVFPQGVAVTLPEGVILTADAKDGGHAAVEFGCDTLEGGGEFLPQGSRVRSQERVQRRVAGLVVERAGGVEQPLIRLCPDSLQLRAYLRAIRLGVEHGVSPLTFDQRVMRPTSELRVDAIERPYTASVRNWGQTPGRCSPFS